MMPTKNHAKVLMIMTVLLLFVVSVETFLTPDWKPMVLFEKILLGVLIWLSGYQWGRYRGTGAGVPFKQIVKNMRNRF